MSATIVPSDLAAIPHGAHAEKAARRLAALTAGEGHRWQPLTPGYSGQRCATATGPRGHVFVKWAHTERSRHAVHREVENLLLLGDHTPTRSPKLVAYNGALATDAVRCGPQHWTPAAVLTAVDTIGELSEAPLTSTYIPTDVLPSATWDHQRHLAAATGLTDPATRALLHTIDLNGIVDDANPAELPTLFGTGGHVACHADGHPHNWVIDTTGTPTLIDWGQLCLGPTGWDLGILTATLGAANHRDPQITADRAARIVATSTDPTMTRRAAAAWWLRFIHYTDTHRNRAIGTFSGQALPFATEVLHHLGYTATAAAA